MFFEWPGNRCTGQNCGRSALVPSTRHLDLLLKIIIFSLLSQNARIIKLIFFHFFPKMPIYPNFSIFRTYQFSPSLGPAPPPPFRPLHSQAPSWFFLPAGWPRRQSLLPLLPSFSSSADGALEDFFWLPSCASSFPASLASPHWPQLLKKNQKIIFH